MTRVTPGSLTERVLERLQLSPVPVRTSVLASQLNASRSALWESLKRLERSGTVARSKVTNERLWNVGYRGSMLANVSEAAWMATGTGAGR